jgi:hypothetical protein
MWASKLPSADGGSRMIAKGGGQPRRQVGTVAANTAGGGAPSQCDWLRDKFGLSLLKLM